MTISTEAIVAGPFIGNGVASSFTFSFKVFADSDVLVKHTDTAGVDTTAVLNTNYIVARNADQDANPGGEIFWRSAGITIPLPAGEKVTLTSEVPTTQQTALPLGGSYSAKTVENMIDKVTMLVKQFGRSVVRSLRQPITDAAVFPELPSASVRRGMYLYFENTPDAFPVMRAHISADTPVSGFMATVLDDANAASARATLGITDSGATAYMQTLLDDADFVAAHNTLAILIPWGVAASDETTALTTGTSKVTFRAPSFATTLVDIQAGLSVAQAAGATLVTVDVNEAGVSLLSTKLTFDNTEKTTTTAATPRVISDSAIAANAELTVDIDALQAGSAAAGLKVFLTLRRA